MTDMTQEMIIKLILTAIVVLLILLLRKFSLRIIQKKEYPASDAKIRAISNTKQIFLIILVLSLTFIWLTQLKDFALSLTAMAVAIVIATKELILCFSGSVLRNLSKSYRIGDRVSIGEFRGDVVDIDMLTTTLLEIGPGNSSHQYTSRSITVPNSLLLTQSTINETFSEEYVLHIITIPISIYENWKKAEQILLESAEEVVAEYKESARKKMEKLGAKKGLEVPNVEPRVTIVLQDKDTYNLLLRIPAPSLRKGKIEQAVLRLFLEKFRPLKSEDAKQTAQ